MELTGILGSGSGYVNLYVFLEAFLLKEEINIQHKEVKSKQKCYSSLTKFYKMSKQHMNFCFLTKGLSS